MSERAEPGSGQTDPEIEPDPFETEDFETEDFETEEEDHPGPTGPYRRGLSKGEIASLVFFPVAAGGLFWLLVGTDWPIGSKAEWFSGLASFGAVAVALWQSVVIRKQAAAESLDAIAGFQDELDAVTERQADQLAAIIETSRLELESAQQRHQAELHLQRELARLQRLHVSELQQKQAISVLSRAVYRAQNALQNLWLEGSKISLLPAFEDRTTLLRPLCLEHAMSLEAMRHEIDNVQLLVESKELHDALHALKGTMVFAFAAEVHLHDAYSRAHPVDQSLVDDAKRKKTDKMDDLWRVAAETLRSDLS